MALDLPPKRVIDHTFWTKEKAQAATYVTWKDGKPFIGDREIIYKGTDIGPILEKVFEELPPAIGGQKFYSYIQQRYVGIRRDDISAWLNKQSSHQIYRQSRKARTGKSVSSSHPGTRWVLDVKNLPSKTWKGKYYSGVLIAVDPFSKFVVLVPVGDEGGAEIVRAAGVFFDKLKSMDPEYAKRVRVVNCDNGPGLGSEEFEEYLKERGVKIVHGASFNPTSQSAAERMARTVGGYAVSWAEQKFGDRTRWVELISDIEQILNATYAKGHGKTPMEVFTAKDRDPDVIDKLLAARASRQTDRLYNDKLKSGDKVRVSYRVMAPTSKIRGQIKNKLRKGYEQNWSDQVFTVHRSFGERDYVLEDEDGNLVTKTKLGKTRVLRYDRADLLKVPSDTVDSHKRSADDGEEDEEEEERQPTPRPKRQRKATRRLIEEA